MRLVLPEGATGAVVMVGGVGGGFDSPARDLYGRLVPDLQAAGVGALRLAYRWPTDLDESVADVRVGVAVLAERGVERIALVGHSLGGAVVLPAAVAEPAVTAVATLASQSSGAEAAGALAGRDLLVVHGSQDGILPLRCSVWIHEIAGQPKDLIVYDGAGHGLDEAADELHQLLRRWLPAVVDPPGAPGRLGQPGGPGGS